MNAIVRCVLIALTVGSAGCFASRARVDTLSTRLVAVETRQETLAAGLEEERRELQQQLAAVQAVMDEAGSLLRRNSADHGLRLDALDQRVSELRGQLAEMQHSTESIDALRAEIREHRASVDAERERVARRLDEVARGAGVDLPLTPEETPAGADPHYRAAIAALRAGEHSRARALLRAFITAYPTDARADDAQLSLGISYRRQGQPAAALAELRRVLSAHRTGDVVDQALFEMAEAFVQIGACSDARDAWQTLVTNFPRSRLAATARTRVRDLARDCDPA